MNKDGHIEFAIMLWIVVLFFLVMGLITGSTGMLVVSAILFIMSFTHPYFCMAPISIIGILIAIIFHI